MGGGQNRSRGLFKTRQGIKRKHTEKPTPGAAAPQSGGENETHPKPWANPRDGLVQHRRPRAGRPYPRPCRNRNRPGKAAVNNALALLRQADKVFAFDAAAGCAFTSTEVEFENEGGSHFAFHAEYTRVCATPSKLRTLEIRGFEHFPSLEEFEAQLLTAKGVHEMEIEKDEPRASIARAL